MGIGAKLISLMLRVGVFQYSHGFKSTDVGGHNFICKNVALRSIRK